MLDVSTAGSTDTTTVGDGRPGRRLADVTLGLTRMVVGFLFACHGADTLLGLFGGEVEAVGAWPEWWAGLIELVGGVLILLGVTTRAAALVCSGTMAYAYFVVHQGDGVLPLQNDGELAALYAWIFLLVAVLGPGAFAVGSVARRRGRG